MCTVPECRVRTTWASVDLQCDLPTLSQIFLQFQADERWDETSGCMLSPFEKQPDHNLKILSTINYKCMQRKCPKYAITIIHSYNESIIYRILIKWCQKMFHYKFHILICIDKSKNPKEISFHSNCHTYLKIITCKNNGMQLVLCTYITKYGFPLLLIKMILELINSTPYVMYFIISMVYNIQDCCNYSLNIISLRTSIHYFFWSLSHQMKIVSC